MAEQEEKENIQKKKTRIKKDEYGADYNFEESDYRTKRAISSRIDEVLNVLERQKVLCSPNGKRLTASFVKKMLLKNMGNLYPQIMKCNPSELYDIVTQKCIKQNMIGTTEAKIRCNECNQDFANQANFLNHQKTPTHFKRLAQLQEMKQSMKTINATTTGSKSNSKTPPQYKNEEGRYICPFCPKFGPTDSKARFLNHLKTKGHAMMVKASEEEAKSQSSSPEEWGCKVCKYKMLFDPEKDRKPQRKTFKKRLTRHMQTKTHIGMVEREQKIKDGTLKTRKPKQTKKSAPNVTKKSKSKSKSNSPKGSPVTSNRTNVSPNATRKSKSSSKSTSPKSSPGATKKPTARPPRGLFEEDTPSPPSPPPPPPTATKKSKSSSKSTSSKKSPLEEKANASPPSLGSDVLSSSVSSQST